MGNVALQLEARTTNQQILQNNNVLFDNIVYQTGDISYNTSTGVINLLKPGRYIIHWWLATQASGSQVGAAFAIVPNLGLNQLGNSPIKTGEVYGFGILDMSDMNNPVNFSIQNLSQQTYYLSAQTPLKGGLIVVEDAEISTPAYGYVFNPLGEITWAAEINTDLVFMQNGPLLNINHTLETTEIYVLEPGDYEIKYTVVLINPIDAILAIAVNGSVIDSTAINTQSLNGEFSDSSIISLVAGDIVTLRLESVSI